MVEEASAVVFTCTPSAVSPINLDDNPPCENVSGPGGNPDVSGGVFGITDWIEIAKVDGGNGFNINGLLNVTGGGTKSGGWTYEGPGAGDPWLPIMIALKAGNESIAYSIERGSTQGTWSTVDLNNKELSNFTFYQSPTPVPFETDVLPLLGAAVFFGGGMWLKRRRGNVSLNLETSTVESSEDTP